MGSAMAFLWESSLMLPLLVAALLLSSRSEGRPEGSEACPRGRALGDKWFNGCHWCVCTARGVHCSETQCSSLVKKVPACHEVGQTWTDGCYNCRCRRRGINCYLDVTCLLLRQHPLPCLADERCVCGPDGVPSCTAEVIDRKAFLAHRVDLGIWAILQAEKLLDTAEAYIGNSDQLSPLRDNQRDMDSASQELLITSDNLCRFGPRWYGGSLRCFCDVDGAITCGNPILVSASVDDFKVRREECEEGHAWEEGCSVCFCRISGVVFCRYEHNCRYDDEDNDYNAIDHYLPGLSESVSEVPEGGLVLVPSLRPPVAVKNTGITSDPGCSPGARWTEDCKRCRCSSRGSPVCKPRQCEKDKGEITPKNLHVRETTPKHEQNGDERKTDRSKATGEDDGQDQSEKVTTPLPKPSHHENDAKERLATMMPPHPPHTKPRGTMMPVPKPTSIQRPPAYVVSPEPKPCGKFDLGTMYWNDCNLCLCTSKGPKCEGKMCR